jgi:hypothetical protein
MERISWTDNVRNEEVLLTVKEQRNMLHEISKRKANWIGHIWRRNCLLQQVIEGKTGIEEYCLLRKLSSGRFWLVEFEDVLWNCLYNYLRNTLYTLHTLSATVIITNHGTV